MKPIEIPKLFCISFILSCLFINCKQKYVDTEKYSYMTIFNPEFNASYEYNIIDMKVIIMQRNDEITKDTFTTLIGFKSEFSKNEKDVYKNLIKFDHYSIVNSNPDSLSNTYQYLLAVFNDLVFEIEYSRAGKITNVQGYEEYKRKATELFNSYSNMNKESFARNNILSMNYFRELFEANIFLLPGIPTQTNNSWDSFETVNLLDQKIQIPVDNSIANVNESSIFITSKGLINEPLQIRNANYMQTRCRYNGTVEIERASGVPLHKEIDLECIGEINIGKIKHTVTRKDTIKLEVKRVTF